MSRLNHGDRAKFKLYRLYFRDLPPGKKLASVFVKFKRGLAALNLTSLFVPLKFDMLIFLSNLRQLWLKFKILAPNLPSTPKDANLRLGRAKN